MGSGPKGTDDLCLSAWEIMEHFMVQGVNMDHRAKIGAKEQGFGLRGWDLGLAAEIWASRLGFGLRGWDLGLKTGI